jgi:hypothetical protein
MSGESESQFARGVPDDILKRDGSLSFTWRLTPLASSTANPHVAALLSSSCSLSGWRPSVRVSGMVEVPCTHALPLLPLLLNTANVKVRRGDKVEEPDPDIIINYLVCRRFKCAPSRVRLRSHELISNCTPFPG